MRSIPQILVQYQRQAGKLQKELAQELGISAQYLSDLQHGRRDPSDTLVARIAGVTGADEHTMLLSIGRIRADVVAMARELSDQTVAERLRLFRELL